MTNKPERAVLWHLTAKALRLMSNLKSLQFRPMCDHEIAPSLLEGCTFQLESLVWIGNIADCRPGPETSKLVLAAPNPSFRLIEKGKYVVVPYVGGETLVSPP